MIEMMYEGYGLLKLKRYVERIFIVFWIAWRLISGCLLGFVIFSIVLGFWVWWLVPLLAFVIFDLERKKVISIFELSEKIKITQQKYVEDLESMCREFDLKRASDVRSKFDKEVSGMCRDAEKILKKNFLD